MFLIVKAVEEIIEKEMKATKGSIMYDGWTNSGTHYLGIFACYMKEISFFENGMCAKNEVLCMPLVSMSPMQHPLDEQNKNEASTKEAVQFNAVTRHGRRLAIS